MSNRESFDYQRHVFHLPKLQSIVAEAVRFFYETPICTLSLPRFNGCGVYALYYLGSYDLYAPLAKLNQQDCVQPIYIGKAMPAGRRTGRVIESQGAELHGRLREHRRSIEQGVHLQLSDFRCRFTILSGVLTDLIVPLESELIRKHVPLWNSVVDGFGNHDPGSGRYDQAPSEWDVLHPGRPWAERLTGEPSRLEDIIARVRSRLAQSPSSS